LASKNGFPILADVYRGSWCVEFNICNFERSRFLGCPEPPVFEARFSFGFFGGSAPTPLRLNPALGLAAKDRKELQNRALKEILTFDFIHPPDNQFRNPRSPAFFALLAFFCGQANCFFFGGEETPASAQDISFQLSLAFIRGFQVSSARHGRCYSAEATGPVAFHQVVPPPPAILD
jgi:hypothetical protein